MKRQDLFLGVCCALSACGGGSSGDPKSAAQFVGKWTANGQITQSVMCGVQSVSLPLWGGLTVSLVSPNSGEIVTVADNGCSLHWVCEGDVATIDPGGNSCLVALPLGGGNWQATFTKGTLTLASNQVALSDNGNAVYTVGGGSENCTFVQSGTFTNTPPDGGN
jgi:hypothetical protein